jgi:hypothetical protein
MFHFLVCSLYKNRSLGGRERNNGGEGRTLMIEQERKGAKPKRICGPVPPDGWEQCGQ